VEARTGIAIDGSERRLRVELRRLVVIRRRAGYGATFPFTMASAKVRNPPEAALRSPGARESRNGCYGKSAGKAFRGANF